MRGMQRLMMGALCALAIGPFGVHAGSAANDGTKALIAAYNGSGQRLFQAFAEKPGNIVLSPYSIGTAMAMALAGARGETEIEMAKVLGLRLSLDEINAANAAALADLGAASSPSLRLFIANALMLTKKGGVISEDYVSTLREKYAAEVFRGADLATVNDWVKQKTAGKIDSLLSRLDPRTVLVLLDAVYFKARWETLFDAGATHKEPFRLLKGEAEVQMMHLRSDFTVAERAGYRAIRLPYVGERVGMIVVLPDKSGAEVDKWPAEDEFQSLLAALHAPAQSVQLSLPRFRASFKADLVAPFEQMGMHRAFDAWAADFSGMTGKPQSAVPLQIDQIVHRAVIDVGEEGTEAAAATGVTVGVAAAPMQRAITFRVDRPFLFAIVDDVTGAVLFAGRIVDPRQAS